MTPTPDTVTTGLYRPADVDEVAYAKFVAKILKSYRRLVAKGRGMYADWTDAQCVENAEFYCRCYRHQFRVLVAIEPGAPR